MSDANIPEVISYFNTYKNGKKMIGVTGDVTIPSFDSITEMMSGAGIRGEYETVIPGNFPSMKQEIQFSLLEDEAFDMMVPGDAIDLTLRASEQSRARSTAAIEQKGLRIVERGTYISHNPGVLSNGKKMNASVTFELLYIMIEVGGKKKLELDKLNDVYIVNGVDVLAKVRANC